jgi:nucleotide-binding universal stress UspA family protein
LKVLLAFEEESCSEEAVREVGSRTWEVGTTVRVLHAVGKFVPPAQELWYDAGGDLEQARREIKDRSAEAVERACDWLRGRGLNAEAVLRDGEPGPVILEEAEQWGADLIVIGTRSHTGLRRILEGSVSQFIVDHASCPVEVVHCQP